PVKLAGRTISNDSIWSCSPYRGSWVQRPLSLRRSPGFTPSSVPTAVTCDGRPSTANFTTLQPLASLANVTRSSVPSIVVVASAGAVKPPAPEAPPGGASGSGSCRDTLPAYHARSASEVAVVGLGRSGARGAHEIIGFLQKLAGLVHVLGHAHAVAIHDAE